MDNSQIIIPEGWTYFAHRTNTERWNNNPFEETIITVNKLMSVVTESDIYRELYDYGKNHLQAYNIGKGEPFEIRCLICDLEYLQKLDNQELKNIMLKEFYYDKRNFGGYYGQRHHSIPSQEELVVLGIGNHEEVFDRELKIIWTIPRRFVDLYKRDIDNKNVRVINIQKTSHK